MINIDRPIKIKRDDVRTLLNMDSLIINPFTYSDIETYKFIFAGIICLLIFIFGAINVNIHDKAFPCVMIIASVIYGIAHLINGIAAVVNSTQYKDFRHVIVPIAGLIGCGLLIYACANIQITSKNDGMNLIYSLLAIVPAYLLCVIRRYLYQHSNELRTSSRECREVELKHSRNNEYKELNPDDLQVHDSFTTPLCVVDALNNFIKKKIIDNELSYCELRFSKIGIWFTKYNTDVVYTVELCGDGMYLIAITTKIPIKPKEPTINDELSQQELQIIASIMKKQSINASRD